MSKYKARHGYDGWPSEMSDVLIDLTVAKKWRKIKREWGVDIKDPWVPFLNAARALLDPRYFIVSPWTEEHFHDFTMQSEVITWGCASSSKAQPLDSLVCTPRGMVTMGTLQVGDLVTSPNGGSTEVVKTHDVGLQDVYEVTLSDGGSCRCAGDHLWKVYRWEYPSLPAIVTAKWLSEADEDLRFVLPCFSESINALGGSTRYLAKVVRTGERVPMKCITVADPEGLYLTDDFIVTHNSNDYGLMLLLDWMVDPYATTTIVGSTTKVDLRVRIWESMVRYHEVMKNNTLGFSIPGHVSEVGFMISNEKVAGDAESMGKKAAIRGIALNEDGRIQGAHLPNVRVLVDELATISNFDALDKGLANLSIAEDFRFYGLANPHTWDDRSCKYCLPADGEKVDVDTGSWTSTRGIFVRHHDGLKSPAYLDPGLEQKFFFLMNRRHVSDNLRRADGNWDAPLMWEQVRGFPLSNGSACPTVLDALVAASNGIGGPMPKPFVGARRLIGRTAGVDPAWSDQGDDSIYAGCAVYEQDGKAMLDFTGLVRKIPIMASSGVPITQQQRDFVVKAIRQDGGPELRCLAGDASGNQGLMDAIVTFVGGNPMAVNNSTRASEYPLKAVDGRPAREYVKDRGTEAWLVLAEFAKAGQVYGLPAGAVDGLTSRRFATRPGSTDTVTPLRLEAKEMFMTRFKGSPNETDACALAALAAKERLGIMPFGALPPPTPASLFPGMTYGDGPAPVTNADTGCAGSYSGSDQDSGGYGSLD